MSKPSSIKIDFELFEAIMEYISIHPDWSDPNYRFVSQGIQNKLKAMLRHNLYTLYKTTYSDDIRKFAINAYLDEIGVPSAFRWSDDD